MRFAFLFCLSWLGFRYWQFFQPFLFYVTAGQGLKLDLLDSDGHDTSHDACLGFDNDGETQKKTWPKMSFLSRFSIYKFVGPPSAFGTINTVHARHWMRFGVYACRHEFGGRLSNIVPQKHWTKFDVWS